MSTQSFFISGKMMTNSKFCHHFWQWWAEAQAKICFFQTI